MARWRQATLFQDMLVDLETAGIVAGGSSLLVFPILFVVDQLLSQEASSSTSSDAVSSFAPPYKYNAAQLG